MTLPDRATRRPILVSGYFSGEGQERKLAYFERLDEALRPHGFELVLFNLAPQALDTMCRSENLEHAVPYSYMLGSRGAIPSEFLLEPLREAVALEAEDLARPVDQAARKIAYFWKSTDEVVHEVKPVLAILWHQFNSLHYALAALYRRLGVPYRFVEYGLLPGTIAFDDGGQMAESWVAQESARFGELPVDEGLQRRVQAYLETCRLERRTRKPQAVRPDIVNRLAAIRETGRPIIFYAGENVTRTGIHPKGYPRASIHTPYFGDTQDALQALVDIAKRRGWHMVFKPHPMAQPTRTPTDDQDVFTLAEDADIFDLIEACDVGTTLVSQACYLMLLHNRPCVLMGKGPMSGAGCAYELTSRDDLERAIESALEHGFAGSQRDAWKRHTAQLCQHYLFAMDDDAENAIGRGPAAAAGELAQLCAATFPAVTRVTSPFDNSAAGAEIQAFERVHRRYRKASRVGAAVATRLPVAIRRALQGRKRWF